MKIICERLLLKLYRYRMEFFKFKSSSLHVLFYIFDRQLSKKWISGEMLGEWEHNKKITQLPALSAIYEIRKQDSGWQPENVWLTYTDLCKIWIELILVMFLNLMHVLEVYLFTLLSFFFRTLLSKYFNSKSKKESKRGKKLEKKQKELFW